MEKKTAHYRLTDVQALVEKNCVRATGTALKNAADLGFSLDDMKFVIQNLEAGDLHKSMTSYDDHTLWQDVYRYPAEEEDIYLKIQITEGLVIVSFKEL